jgi:hypothetical protein
MFNPVSVVQPLWKRDDGATATITGAFISKESPAAKEFLEQKIKEETEQGRPKEPRFYGRAGLHFSSMNFRIQLIE